MMSHDALKRRDRRSAELLCGSVTVTSIKSEETHRDMRTAPFKVKVSVWRVTLTVCLIVGNGEASLCLAFFDELPKGPVSRSSFVNSLQIACFILKSPVDSVVVVVLHRASRSSPLRARSARGDCRMPKGALRPTAPVFLSPGVVSLPQRL
uniref:Uncharacterized protein n=1 Tax=Knipowitschia caucasica TaxID=637954 RepID=A0AAV2KQ26_KNICA